jgi:phage shock protein A
MITLLFETLVGIFALIVLLDFFTGFRMTKSLINRLRQKTDEAAENLRDPVADAHVALQDIQNKKNEMVELRKKLLIQVKTAKSQQTRANSDITKYDDLAKLAGNAGNADDVKTALEKKASAKTKLDNYANDVVRLTKQEDELENRIKEFTGLLEKAEQDKTFLQSELEIRKFQTSVNSVLRDNTGTALSAIDRLRADVDKAKAEAEVSDELVGEATTLESKYSPKSVVSDDDIALYMQKK